VDCVWCGLIGLRCQTAAGEAFDVPLISGLHAGAIMNAIGGGGGGPPTNGRSVALARSGDGRPLRGHERRDGRGLHLRRRRLPRRLDGGDGAGVLLHRPDLAEQPGRADVETWSASGRGHRRATTVFVAADDPSGPALRDRLPLSRHGIRSKSSAATSRPLHPPGDGPLGHRMIGVADPDAWRDDRPRVPDDAGTNGIVYALRTAMTTCRPSNGGATRPPAWLAQRATGRTPTWRIQASGEAVSRRRARVGRGGTRTPTSGPPLAGSSKTTPRPLRTPPAQDDPPRSQ